MIPETLIALVRCGGFYLCSFWAVPERIRLSAGTCTEPSRRARNPGDPVSAPPTACRHFAERRTLSAPFREAHRASRPQQLPTRPDARATHLQSPELRSCFRRKL